MRISDWSSDVCSSDLLDGYEAPSAHRTYIDWAMERRRRYPAVLPEYWQTQGVVNPYCFTERLFDEPEPDEVIVMADATAAVVTVQAAQPKNDPPLYPNSAEASMGYDLHATIHQKRVG